MTDPPGNPAPPVLAYAPARAKRWGPWVFRPRLLSWLLVAGVLCSAAYLRLHHSPWERVAILNLGTDTPPTAVQEVRFTPEGLLLIHSCAPHFASLWDSKSGQFIRHVGPADASTRGNRFEPLVQLLDDRRRVIFLHSGDPANGIYDLRTGQCIHRVTLPHEGAWYLVSEDARYLACVPPYSSYVTTFPTTCPGLWRWNDSDPAAPEWAGDIPIRWVSQVVYINGQPVCVEGGKHPVVALADDGDTLIIDRMSGGMALKSLKDGHVTREIHPRHVELPMGGGEPWSKNAVAPDNFHLLFAAGDAWGNDGSAWIQVMDLTGRSVATRVLRAHSPHFTFTSSRISVAGHDGLPALLLSTSNLRTIAVLAPGEVGATSPDDQWLVLREFVGLSQRATTWRRVGRESALGVLGMPQCWLFLVCCALLAASLFRDTRRIPAGDIAWPGLRFVCLTMLALGFLGTLKLLLEWCIEAPRLNPLPVYLLVGLGLSLRSRFWHWAALLALAATLPLIATLAKPLWPPSSGADFLTLLDREWLVPRYVIVAFLAAWMAWALLSMALLLRGMLLCPVYGDVSRFRQ